MRGINKLYAIRKTTSSLNKTELESIIEQLESSNSKDDAYFGLFDDGSESGEGFIKANREGLSLFAAALLKAARDVNDNTEIKEKIFYPLTSEKDWIDENSHLLINYIEPSNEPREKAEFQPYIKSKKDKALEILVGLVVIFVIVATIIGIITIVKWLFGD